MKLSFFSATLLAFAHLVLAGAEPSAKALKAEKHRTNIDRFFALAGPVAELSFEFAPEELEKLRTDPRNYAEATMKEAGGKTYRGVGVKLKGGRSFRGIDDKPGMTVNLKKYPGGERFRGMEKFHLNNSVQDKTYLHEIIAAEMCRAVGVPAGRGTHALVAIGGKERGLYVFKEAYDEDFLAHFFRDPTGDLYDGGSWAELKETMEKDQGSDTERDNIKELIGACREPDEARRWTRLDAILDVDAYLTFTALEAILAQHDGYNFNHNNYRVYFDPASGKAHFVHHGLDQAFGSKTFSLLTGSASLVWRAVFSNPEWQGRYFGRVREAQIKLRTIDWEQRAAAIGAKVQAALEKNTAPVAAEFPAKLAAAQAQFQERLAFVEAQLTDPPAPVVLGLGDAYPLTDGWTRRKLTGADFTMREATLDGGDCLHVRTGQPGGGFWWNGLLLARGRYRFEGRAKTAGVVPDTASGGKGLSLLAKATVHGGKSLAGDHDWQPVACEFESYGAQISLSVDFRAAQGEVWIDRSSLRLVRLQ